ncbi:hypothetical protein [Aliamphritea hakodatensis]|uniref:hypothetical protein n=1 Tax=Aliamphritea hakodatensis TaxID=2895352 RepID=UPI0022FDA6C5|nr:hypothetical protein [Aliamphritea hakodatensis]
MTSQHMQIDLPAPRQGLRSTIKKPRYMHYNRLITLIFLVNAAALGYGFTQSWWTGGGIALQVLADLTLFNLGLAILARQQYVINCLFWLFTRAPTSWPLAIRWTLGKVYHYGGLHKGGALAGTLWFIIFAGSASYQFQQNLPGISAQSLGLIYGLLVLLVLIVVMAQKTVRARYHDAFERTHRFGGWLSLALFWGLTLSFIDDQRGAQSFSDALTGATSFWILCLLTASIILPWLRLRRVPVQVETPSNHVAVATFDHGVTPFAGSSTAISLNPLMEWHHFANAPSPHKDGFRLVISRAGDWTGNFIEQKPSHVWVKGIPQAGVAYIEVLFKKVVYVATGSGIGPVLPHLLAQDVPIHLIWSTREPRKTYGDALVDEILEAQPDAHIWDTDANGKPDLVRLAYQACQEHGAEAVICISNEKLTWQVVYGMESRGIPAYGAIWDS